jgi:hypothetical protein
LIKKLAIRGFRGIKEGEIELSPITILLGSNNSGKSTLLEALFLAPNPCRWVPYYIQEFSQSFPSSALEIVYFLHKTLDYRGYAFLLHNYTSKSAEIEFETGEMDDLFGEKKHFLHFLKKDQFIYLSSSEEVAINAIKINDIEVPFFAQLSVDQLNYGINRTDAFSEDVLLLSPKLSLAGYEYFRRQWPEIVNSGISRKVAEDASKLSPERYMDFTMEPMIGGRVDLHAYLDDGRRIRLGDLGEGMQSYVLSRTLVELRKPQVILWDDIESHLNPRMLNYIADWFADLVQEKKQIVVSTHSLEATKVIAGINEENAKICLCTMKNSILKTKFFTLNEVEKLQESGIDARTAEALML